MPAGSIPKDGPSAGITIAAAMLSVLTGRPVDRSVAMTGEITLRGDILPIGGLKEKVLAARLAGVKRVILPKLNERDLVEVPAPIKKDLDFRFVGHVDEVLAMALLGGPPPASLRPVSSRRVRPPGAGSASLKPPSRLASPRGR